MNRRAVKRLLLVALISLIAKGAFAKKDSVSYPYRDFGNSIVFSSSYFYFPKVEKFLGEKFRLKFFIPLPYTDFYFADQLSINYERKVYGNWRIGIGYTTWDMNMDLNGYTYGGVTLLGSPNSGKVGEIEFRKAYKMYDLYANYRMKHLKKHRVAGGIGLSYTWGTNTYIDSIFSPPGSFEQVSIGHEEKAHYYGILASLRYDYIILHNRANVGADCKYRNYSGLYGYQLEYGFHLGFNF
jgi:hypothetical protein